MTFQGRVLGRALITIAAALAVTFGATGPAAANPASGSWVDNHMICNVSSCVNTGNLVKLWQSILWADAYFSSTSSIDGDFSNDTDAKTEAWQRAWNTRFSDNDATDGWVGPQTWGNAQWLLWYGITSDPCSSATPPPSHIMTYYGKNGRSFRLKEVCAGSWYFDNPATAAADWTDTNHGS